jgi:hypothetical protein
VTEAEQSPAEQLLEELEAFLVEFSLAPYAVDKAIYTHFLARLRAGMKPFPQTIVEARRWMAELRAEEPKRISEAAAAIRGADGFIALTPGGEILCAPDGVDHKRLKRMIEQGVLVPSGDSMFGVASQTYKPSSLAR